MKNILVTGCAGFIGWKVSERLLDEGFNIVGIDNLNDYYDPRLKEWRLNQLRKRSAGESDNKPDFHFFIADIADFRSVKTVFANNEIQAVINLAARAGVRASVEDPWVYLDTNVKGTLNLLECCKEYNV